MTFIGTRRVAKILMDRIIIEGSAKIILEQFCFHFHLYVRWGEWTSQSRYGTTSPNSVTEYDVSTAQRVHTHVARSIMHI